MRYSKILIPAFIAICAWSVASIASATGVRDFTPGISYVSVSPSQPTTVKPGQIEVIEFFWYGCPHCFALEPYLEAWLKHKPSNVVFRRIPVAMAWGEHMDVDGHAYYTAQALGLEPGIHTPLFNAIHQDKQFALVSDKDALQGFFVHYGVKKQDFDAAWNSFSVQLKMNQAADTEQRYGLESVPTLIVNGQWKTGAGYKTADSRYMSPKEIMQCVNMLVEKEESRLKHQAQGN
jgi:protein dithiol oxidoreductase (disulfide-forming)